MRRTPFLMLIVGLILSAFWLGEAQNATAQPSAKCAQERAQAEDFFLDGALGEAIALLQQCLDRETLAVDEAMQVYRLLSLAHLNNDDLEQAQRAVRDLLVVVPAYEADPVQDPPSYTTMVAVIRQERAAQAPPAAEEALPEAEPARPQEEIAEEPQAEQPEAGRPPVRPNEPVLTPVVTGRQPARRQGLLSTPRSWVLATGGAIVVATAVALVLGGGSGPNSSVQR